LGFHNSVEAERIFEAQRVRYLWQGIIRANAAFANNLAFSTLPSLFAT
jgi:hypothetical protein